jgi:heme/copper-type cytochrome/quinol oxidase subunit 2
MELTVKAVGRQWYWQYAMRESVDFSVRNVNMRKEFRRQEMK